MQIGILLSFHNRCAKARRSRSPSARLTSGKMAEAEPQTQNLNNLDQTPIIPLPSSIFETDDDFSGDASSSAVITGGEDLDFIRPSKRRKTCPFALDRLEDLTPDSNRSFSFTFDTKSGGSAPEITPKFGSFNLTKWEQEGQKLGNKIREEEEEEEKAAEEDQEVKKEGIAEAEGVVVRD